MPLPPGSLRGPASNESVTELPLMLKALPHDWSAPHNEPAIQQAVAALQNVGTGSPAQPPQEAMDMSGSVATASEATTSKTPSERQEREATEGILIAEPDSVQETRDEDDEDYDDEGESDKDDEDEEECEESPMAEVKSAKSSGTGPKGKGIG